MKALKDTNFMKNRILYTDNYCTFAALTRFLLQEETGTCGPVRQKRKNWPAFTPKTSEGNIVEKGEWTHVGYAVGQ